MDCYPNFSEEKRLWNAKFKYIAGVDEVGRGPLAGPVVIAAVILPENFKRKEIADSKKLPAYKREDLFEYITHNAIAYSIEVVNPKVVDRLNIYQAVYQGMRKVVKKLNPQPDFILIDAMNISYPEVPQKAIIKGDNKVVSIAAASIIAKVYRDRLMTKYAQTFPQYGFEFHMGYGTEAHLKSLDKYGPCSIHRFSFEPVRLAALKHKKKEDVQQEIFV